MSISAESGTQLGVPVSYCWDGFCVDGVPVVSDDKTPLVVGAEELISFNIKSSERPNSISIMIQEPIRSIEDWPNDPSSITLKKELIDTNSEDVFKFSTEPGLYVLSIAGAWDGEDLSAMFLVEVQ